MEFLKQHLSTELYQQLADALKSNDKVKLANLAEGEYVFKRKYDDELQKSIDLTAKITERDTQIAELGKTVGLTDEFKKQIKELQDEHSQKIDEGFDLSQKIFVCQMIALSGVLIVNIATHVKKDDDETNMEDKSKSTASL